MDIYPDRGGNVTTVSIIVTADSKENPGIGHVGVEYAPPPFQARELKSAKNEIVGINKVSIPPPPFQARELKSVKNKIVGIKRFQSPPRLFRRGNSPAASQ